MPHEEAAMTYVCMNDFRDAADLTLVIREESVTDVSARERLLDVAFGPSRFAKTCERLREGRAPAQGLALVAHVGDELVGTIRFWNNGVLLGTAFQGLGGRGLCLVPAVCLGSNTSGKPTSVELVEFNLAWLGPRF